MLYIFDSTEKLITTLPKGSFFNAVHSEVLNGENTFEFAVPAGNENVVEGNLVAFRDLDSYWQVFEIKRLVDTHGDGLTRTAYCEHIFYELLDDIVIDKRPSADATAALAGMLDGTRWQVGIVDDLGASSTSAYYESALSAVQKVANAWHGELNWRCVIQGGAITRYVDLLAQCGTDTGKQFAYSKDILNIEREVDSSGVVTALYGRGKGIELDSGSYGRRLTFANVVAADKPAGQEWIGDDDALSRWGRNGRHRFDVFVDEEETDPEVLLQKTRDELARRKVPRVTYRLDVVSLEQLTGYEHEKVRKGDLVRVIDREFTPELVVSARVIDIERDLLDPANTKVVLGSFAPTIVEATINTARRVNEMANRPFNTKWLDGKISVLQNAIENTQSYVFQTADDGILILDAADYATATKAMKLGGGIFAIANQKDGQGGWNWRTFGDGSGFTADLITAGIIDAGLVQIGHETTFEAGYDPVDNHLYFEYSVDGMNWHTIFNSASDLYMRQKVGDNGTWSEPARIAAVDGVDGYTPVKGVDYFDGVDGQDGTSAYLWVRYSQNANGNPMTTDPTGAVYIGVATTATPTAPTSYTAYQWSLIKGQDGIPGEAGEDGQTSYLHIKYSDDGTTFTGNGGEDVGAYIGTYVDFTQADSTNFGDYTWNKVKGEDGRDGYTPIKGVDYFDGVDGQPGADGIDGTSAYLWIRYSQNSNGNPMTTDPTNAVYIGIATTTTPSAPTSYTAYSWSLIKGQDGIPGETGADGQTSYLHIKYSDDGVNFTANNGEDVGAWIGTYVDFNPVDSMNFNDYTWNKVRGEDGYTPVKGTDYFDGVDGQDGTSSYLWVRYSQNSNGDPMTTDPTGAIYIGIATTTTPTAPTSYTSYSWSLIKGADGIPGEAGADGRTSYLHIKYSDDGETFTPTWDWETEIENVTYSYVQSLHGTLWAAQGFKPTENLVGATTIRASLRSNGYIGVLPDTYWHVYTDNNGIPGVSISQDGFGTVLGVDWAKSLSWSTAEIKLSEPLQEGQQYWLVVMSENGDSSNRVQALYSGSDVYADGYRCTSSNKGASWTKSLNRDLTFKIEGYNIVSYDGETPGKYIGTYVDFNPVDSTIFNDYTWNRVKGTPIVWKGELASPPSNPEENWVYRDTDNGYVYIYNGTAWELMVTDGADGIDGAPGVDGMSVYITYHNNPTDSQPATPTGDGTSGGWYTAPSAQANWMSQKVATNAYSGTWGAPILISGGRKFTSQPVPPYDVGDLWIGGSDGQNTLICTTARSSGSFVASDWERMTEPVANMGVDSDCLGLWHFDGSLNSHKGLTPTFTRPSPAYLEDGTQVASGVPRFEDGKFGKGVLIEEGTTNLLTADQSSFETSAMVGTFAAGGSPTISLDSTTAWTGTKSVKLTMTGTGGAGTNITPAIPVTAGQTYTFSIYTKESPSTGKTKYVHLSWRGSGGNTVGSTQSVVISATPDWQRLIVTGTAPANAVSVYLYAHLIGTIAPGDIQWLDGAQFEQKAYATSWQIGGTTRAAEQLTIPDVLHPRKGTINIWHKWDNLNQIIWKYVLCNNVACNAANNFSLVMGVTGGSGSFYVRLPDNTNVSKSFPMSAINTNWQMYTVVYDADEGILDLYIDGQLITDGQPVNINTLNLEATLHLSGHLGDMNHGANGLRDELRIDKIARTDAEISGWYKANAPFYTSEDQKQWPGYMKLETDGIKVYDSSDALRVLLGSWLSGAIRKYGLKIIGGEIYSTTIQTGEEGDAQYIAFESPNRLVMYAPKTIGSTTPVKVLEMVSPNVADKAGIDWYDANGAWFGQLIGQGSDKSVSISSMQGKLGLYGSAGVTCLNGLNVSGGTKNCVEDTIYGKFAISARESPEVRYIDEGMGILSNGERRIEVDPIFMECIEPHTPDSRWYIQLTPYADVDLYVAEIGDGYFVVKEQKDGTSTGAEFTWSLSATRKDYALIRFMEVLD